MIGHGSKYDVELLHIWPPGDIDGFETSNLIYKE